MNKILAETLALFNAIAAMGNICAGAALGFYSAPYLAPLFNIVPNEHAQHSGFFIGAFLGFVVAVMTNGVLALLIAMYAELKRIR